MKHRNPVLDDRLKLWITEGISPLQRPVELRDTEPYWVTTWHEDYRWARLLPLAWHSRRSDDWSAMKEQVDLLGPRSPLSPEEEFDQRLAVYGALMHLLLYSGDGRHPLRVLEDLTYTDPEIDLLAGYTSNFKNCFERLLRDLHVWWHESPLLSPEWVGMTVDDVDEDICHLDERDRINAQTAQATWDTLHLSMHCGAPVHPLDLDEREASVRKHEPRVMTLVTPTYKYWMRALRSLEVDQSTVVKVMLEDDKDFFDGPVLGFWLVTPFDSHKNSWRNSTRFITDAQVPAVLWLVSELQ